MEIELYALKRVYQTSPVTGLAEYLPIRHEAWNGTGGKSEYITISGQFANDNGGNSKDISA